MAVPQQQTMPLFEESKNKPLLMLMDGHAVDHRSLRDISVQRDHTISSTDEVAYGYLCILKIL